MVNWSLEVKLISLSQTLNKWVNLVILTGCLQQIFGYFLGSSPVNRVAKTDKRVTNTNLLTGDKPSGTGVPEGHVYTQFAMKGVI